MKTSPLPCLKHPVSRSLSALLDYIVKTFILETQPRKTGPNVSTRSTWNDVAIIAFYEHQLDKANKRKKAGVTDVPASRAKAQTARKFGVSVRTIESLLTDSRQRAALLKAQPK